MIVEQAFVALPELLLGNHYALQEYEAGIVGVLSMEDEKGTQLFSMLFYGHSWSPLADPSPLRTVREILDLTRLKLPI